MRHYIENVLINTYDQQDAKTFPLHQEVYAVHSNSIINIEKLMDLCLQIGRAPQRVYNDELEGRLAIEHYYLSVLGDIYSSLKQITDKYAAYTRNQIYKANQPVTL